MKRAVASCLAALLAWGCARVVSTSPPPEMPRTVVVLPPNNRTGDPLLVAGATMLERYVTRGERVAVPDVLASEARIDLERRGLTVVPAEVVDEATGRVPTSVEDAAALAMRAKPDAGAALYLEIRRWEPDAATHPAFIIVGMTASLVEPASGRVIWSATRPSKPVATPGEISAGAAYVTAARAVMEEMLAPLGPAGGD